MRILNLERVAYATKKIGPLLAGARTLTQANQQNRRQCDGLVGDLLA